MSLGYMLRRIAEEKGGREGVIFQDCRLTYGEFNSRVNRVANTVKSLGIKKGDRVAILMFNSHQYMEVYFAMAKLGVILVTLNYRLVGKELQYILDDSTPTLLFLGEEFIETISSIRHSLPYIRHYVLIGEKTNADIPNYEAFLGQYQDHEPEEKININDEQLIIYTSGTTGYPKGVLITHSNTLWTCLNQILFFKDLSDKDSTLVVAPLYHCGAQNDLTMPIFQVGGKIVIMRHVEPLKVLEIIQKERITTALLLPTLLHMMFQISNLDDYDLSSLRYVVTGGGPLPEVTMEKFYKKMGFHVCQGFGLTEGTAVTSTIPMEYGYIKKGSVGKPLFYVEAKIVNDQGKEMAPGEVGELIQRGPTVMKGYWNNPKATEETIVGGWLHTGDLARFDKDGFLYIVDRKKDMIISGEENIYPAEIEQVLYSHPKILEAAVIGVPDEKWGESVKAIIVCKPSETITEKEVIDYCKKNLASYKKPKSVEFVDQLPRNPSMKILKNVLREKYGKKAGVNKP